MKSRFLLGLVFFLALFASGCSTWPKDALIRGAEVTTPWGHTSAEVIATGKAAQNLSAEERAAVLAPATKKP